MSQVTIYTTPTCGFCHMAKDFFRQNKVNFTEIDVTKDRKQMEEVVAATGQMGVPVIKIDDDYIIGFDKPSLSEKLGL